MFVLMAMGPNGNDFPCMFFDSKDAGVKYLAESDMVSGHTKLVDGSAYVSDVLSENSDVAARFFVSYYDGAGGVDGFVLVEMGVGQPFVSFSGD